MGELGIPFLFGRGAQTHGRMRPFTSACKITQGTHEMPRHKTNVHSSIIIQRLDWMQRLIFSHRHQLHYRTSKIDHLQMSLGIREVTLEYLLCVWGSVVGVFVFGNLIFLLTLSSFGKLTAAASDIPPNYPVRICCDVLVFVALTLVSSIFVCEGECVYSFSSATNSSSSSNFTFALQ